MSELIAFTSESENGAKALEADLIAPQESQDLRVGDAALVVRMADSRPEFNHAVNLVGRGSMGGIFWGFILALVFWTRWWGLSIGGALGDLRLEEDFVKEVGAGVLEVAESRKPKVFQSTLSEDDEQVLKVIFQATRVNS